MTKNPIFRGAATALVTPLNENGVDYVELERLINWQIEEGIDGLVIAGTTGEGSTLTDEEHRDLFEKAIQMIDGRVPAIAALFDESNQLTDAAKAAMLADSSLADYTISQLEAENLLLEGFVGEVVAKCDIEPLAEILCETLQKRLNE